MTPGPSSDDAALIEQAESEGGRVSGTGQGSGGMLGARGSNYGCEE